MLDLYINGIKKKTYTNTKMALKASNSIKKNNQIKTAYFISIYSNDKIIIKG